MIDKIKVRYATAPQCSPGALILESLIVAPDRVKIIFYLTEVDRIIKTRKTAVFERLAESESPLARNVFESMPALMSLIATRRFTGSVCWAIQTLYNGCTAS